MVSVVGFESAPKDGSEVVSGRLAEEDRPLIEQADVVAEERVF